jgi:hypothetical protein
VVVMAVRGRAARTSRVWTLREWAGSSPFVYRHRDSEVNFCRSVCDLLPWRPDPLHPSVVASKDLCLVIGVQRAAGRPESLDHVHTDFCTRLYSFAFAPSRARAELGFDLLLVSHLRCRLAASKKRTGWEMQASNQTFGVLQLAAEDPTTMTHEALENLTVVAVTADGYLYQPRAALCTAIIRMKQAQYACSRRVQQTFPSPADQLRQRPAPALDGSAGQQQQQQQQQKKKRTRDESEQHGFHSRQVCPCDACSGPEASKYAGNMSANGPQRLYRQPFSAYQWLRFLGRWDEEAERMLLQAGRLSLAAWDVESVAVEVEATAGDEAHDFPESVISGLRLPRRTESVQHPVRIGFAHSLMLERGEPVDVCRAVHGEGAGGIAEDGENRDSLTKAFVEVLRRRRDEAVAAKRAVLAPLFVWLAPYKRAYFAALRDEGLLPDDYNLDDLAPDVAAAAAVVHDEEDDDADAVASALAAEEDPLPSDDGEAVSRDEPGDDPILDEALRKVAKMLRQRNARLVSQAKSGWTNSPHGLLERRLERLASSFLCFALNGEGYDMVVLASRLAVLSKTMGLPGFAMGREGTRVTHLRLDGILMAEAKKLVGPGTSLDSLARACNLPISKGAFPFKVFRHYGFLLRPDLPDDLDSWVSDLNPAHSLGPKELGETLSAYRSGGYANTGEFLDAYLAKDVELLLLSMQALQSNYYRILGVCLVEARKLTVSSLSSYGAHSYLADRRRPGAMVPNHLRMFNVSLS